MIYLLHVIYVDCHFKNANRQTSRINVIKLSAWWKYNNCCWHVICDTGKYYAKQNKTKQKIDKWREKKIWFYHFICSRSRALNSSTTGFSTSQITLKIERRKQNTHINLINSNNKSWIMYSSRQNWNSRWAFAKIDSIRIDKFYYINNVWLINSKKLERSTHFRVSPLSLSLPSSECVILSKQQWRLSQ